MRRNYTSIFKREPKAKVYYVIHKYFAMSKPVGDKIVHLEPIEVPAPLTLPYLFKTRQQANRYLEDVIGASISHGEFLDKMRNRYYVQHLSEITEITIKK